MADQLSQLGAVEMIQITARLNDRIQGSCQLSSGNTVIVGSGPSCSLVLKGPDVSPMHCLISSDGRTVSVQEWTGTQGVCVNGQPIHGEAKVGIGDVIGLGQFVLSFEALEPADLDQKLEEGTPTNSTTNANPAMPSWNADSTDETVCENFVEPDVSNELLRTSSPETPDSFLHSEAEDETIVMLRAEISLLHGELADRDALLRELDSDSAVNDEFLAPSFEDDPSLQRLDELLDELAKSDERAGLLEELITASEIAASAERDERRQLEAWVGEIERRISSDESESQAEIEALGKQIEQLRGERDRAQFQLQNAASGDGAKEEFNNALQELRRENTALATKLLRAESQQTDLQQQLDSADIQNAVRSQQAQLDEALREERAKLAQETADLTRSRAVLANQLAEIQRAGLEGQANGADERVRALRNHLKDIHEQERDETEERRGLMARISGLWKSVDNGGNGR